MKRSRRTQPLVIGILLLALCGAGFFAGVITLARNGITPGNFGFTFLMGGGVFLGISLISASRAHKVPAIIMTIIAILMLGIGSAVFINPSETTSRAPLAKTPTNEPTDSNPSAYVEYTSDELAAMSEEFSVFVKELFYDAVDNLIASGAIEDFNKVGVFSFESVGTISFNSDYNPSELRDWNVDNLNNLMLAECSIRGEAIYSNQRSESFTVYYKYDSASIDEKPYRDEIPLLFPVTTSLIDKESTWDLFANSLDECRYVLLYGGFESARWEDYYIGDIDRISIATLVFLIDVETREFVCIKELGADTPGTITTNTTGQLKSEEALDFIEDLLD